jgi:hypothetical protein
LLSLTNFIQNNIQQDQVNELSFSNNSFSIKSNTECGNVTNCDDVMPAFYSLDLNQYEMSEADKIVNQITDIAVEQVSFNILTGGLGSLASLSGKLAIYVLSKPAVKEFLIKAAQRLNSFKISDNICPIPSYAGNISNEVTKGKNFLKDIFDKAKDYIKSVGKIGDIISKIPKYFNKQKQLGHIFDTPQYLNRLKSGKPTSYFKNVDDAVKYTDEAWSKGTINTKLSDPSTGKIVKDYNFGFSVGKGPKGGNQTSVRVHSDSKGQIHGHPNGIEIP